MKDHSRGRMLVATQVVHTLYVLRKLAVSLDVHVTTFDASVLEVTGDVHALLACAVTALSSTEADEVRVLVVEPGTAGRHLTGLALSAPSLATAAARSAASDLLPLFRDGGLGCRYQPVADLRTAATVGYQSLLHGPDGEPLSEELRQAARSAGWSHALDRAGRNTAIRGATGWLGEDRLFLDVEATSVYRPEVCLRTTRSVARRSGLSMGRLVFEVSGAERREDAGHVAGMIAHLRDLGCGVALAGTGEHSWIAAVTRLRPDVVRLGAPLVGARPDPVSTAVIRAVVDLVHGYGGLVLADGLADAEQTEIARALGVDLGRGWYFGDPEQMRPRAAGLVPRQPSGEPADVIDEPIVVGTLDPSTYPLTGDVSRR